MKYWTAKFSSMIACAALLGLTACQQGSQMSPAKAAYQQNAGAAVQKYAASISRAITAGRGATSSVHRAISGGWDPFGGAIYGGGQPISNSIDSETTRCASVMEQIPRTAQYFYLRLGTLSRCLDVITNYRNPLMTYGYRNLDQSSQYGWGYNLNYARPTSYSNFSGQDYNSWNPYAQNGFYQSQVPNYSVPGFGF